MGIENIFLYSSIFLSTILLINFLFMIIKYHKEKMLPICLIDEQQLLKKHGPIICSCILQKRNFKPRDIIATLVGLIQKDVISIELRRTSEEGSIINEYHLKMLENDVELDEIEQQVLSIFFKGEPDCVINAVVRKAKRQIETVRLEKFVNNKLEEIGANVVKVPKKVQIVNNLFFILVCIFFVIHVINSFESVNFFENLKINLKNWFVIVIKLDALVILGTILIKLLVLLADRIKDRAVPTEIELSDGIILKIFIKFVIANFIILILLMFAGTDLRFIADIILFDLAMVVMVTDEMFSLHSSKIKKEYMSLMKFKEKLETNEIIEYFNIDKVEILKSYIPFLLACNLKKANAIEYTEKFVNTCMDEKEKKKYEDILELIQFDESIINQFYFSDTLKK